MIRCRGSPPRFAKILKRDFRRAATPYGKKTQPNGKPYGGRDFESPLAILGRIGGEIWRIAVLGIENQTPLQRFGALHHKTSPEGETRGWSGAVVIGETVVFHLYTYTCSFILAPFADWAKHLPASVVPFQGVVLGGREPRLVSCCPFRQRREAL